MTNPIAQASVHKHSIASSTIASRINCATNSVRRHAGSSMAERKYVLQVRVGECTQAGRYSVMFFTVGNCSRAAESVKCLINYTVARQLGKNLAATKTHFMTCPSSSVLRANGVNTSTICGHQYCQCHRLSVMHALSTHSVSNHVHNGKFMLECTTANSWYTAYSCVGVYEHMDHNGYACPTFVVCINCCRSVFSLTVTGCANVWPSCALMDAAF